MGIIKKASLDKISLVPKGLRYKLMIVFCLMSIIPLLVAAYIVRDYDAFATLLAKNSPFPISSDMLNFSWILFFCLIIVVLGLLLAKQMIEPIIEMAIEAKLIAEGDLDRRVPIYTEDEIGGLGRAINQLTSRIKSDMQELRTFGERTKILNTEIHRRVLALSNLLQIGENISSSEHMGEVMNLIVEKVIEVFDIGYAMLFLLKSRESDNLELHVAYNIANEKLNQLEVRIGRDVLGAAIIDGAIIYSDSKTKQSKEIENFKKAYNIVNFAAIPIISRNKAVGLFFVGNEIKDFKFTEDDIALVKILSKQAAIAYENGELLTKAKELAVKDDLTDLYNEKFITTRLDEEIKRAILYQRPCSYIVFNVDDFDDFRKDNGELATERALKKIATVLKENVTQIGRAARLSGDGFALLLPEKNKKEAYRIAEDVRKKVENLDLELDKKIFLTISGGVSENPLDGSSAEELIKKAAESVITARSQGKNRIA